MEKFYGLLQKGLYTCSNIGRHGELLLGRFPVLLFSGKIKRLLEILIYGELTGQFLHVAVSLLT